MGYDDGFVGNGYSLGVKMNQLYPVFDGIEDINPGFTFPSVNQWYQIVMLRNSGTTFFYVNGVPTIYNLTDTPQNADCLSNWFKHWIQVFQWCN